MKGQLRICGRNTFSKPRFQLPYRARSLGWGFSHIGRPDLVFSGWVSPLLLCFLCSRTRYPPRPRASKPTIPGTNLTICSPWVGVAGAWVGLLKCRVEEKRIYICRAKSRIPSAARPPPCTLANCIKTPSSSIRLKVESRPRKSSNQYLRWACYRELARAARLDEWWW